MQLDGDEEKPLDPAIEEHVETLVEQLFLRAVADHEVAITLAAEQDIHAAHQTGGITLGDLWYQHTDREGSLAP